MGTKSISNVFKIFGVVSLVGLLGVVNLQADETSEVQAAQTEQGTQAQTQEQKVDSSAESKSINANASTSKANKSGAFGFCKGQHASTGCFIGASVGLAFGENYIPSFSTGGEYIGSQEKNFVAVPVNIDFGWQWYYAQNAGFRFKGYVGYSNYNTNFDEKTSSGGMAIKFDTSIHAIQYGLEASYLYDFIYKGDHNFGAHISVGFEGSSFVGQGVDVTTNNRKLSGTFPSYSKFTWTSGIGIHYFYKVHHQFFLSYLYRGYTNDKTVANEAGGTADADGQAGRLAANIFKISTTPNSTIMLSYAYKF